jgi:anti-sigma B factor antagonist
MTDLRKTYNQDSDGNSVVFHLKEDDLSLINHHELTDDVNKEIDNGISFIQFDLNDLDSINSSGLGILISNLKKVKEKSGRLRLINVNEKIFNVFKLTKLNDVFEIQY